MPPRHQGQGGLRHFTHEDEEVTVVVNSPVGPCSHVGTKGDYHGLGLSTPSVPSRGESAGRSVGRRDLRPLNTVTSILNTEVSINRV